MNKLIILFIFSYILFAKSSIIDKNIYIPFGKTDIEINIEAISDDNVLINGKWFSISDTLFEFYKIVKITSDKIKIKNIVSKETKTLLFLNKE